MSAPLQTLMEGVAKVLINDTDVTGEVDSISLSGGGSNPAIFIGSEVPEEDLSPYVKIIPPHSSPHDHLYSNKKTDPTKPFFDVRILAKKSPDPTDINKAADSVYNSLHDEPKKLTDQLDDRECMSVQCSGPLGGGKDEEYEARVVQVTANLSDPNS